MGMAAAVVTTGASTVASISGAGVAAAVGTVACVVASRSGAAAGAGVAVGACVGFSPSQAARSANDRTLIIQSRIAEVTLRILADSRSGPHFARVLH